MPGKSSKTRPAAVRLGPFGFQVLDALAEQLDCSRSEAHKRALVAGAAELLGPSRWRQLNDDYRARNADGVNR